MLRGAVVALGVLLLAGGLFVIVVGPAAPGITATVLGALILLGTLFERRYHPVADHPPTGPGWARTAERFHDPGGEGMVEVWYQQRTGRRRYVRLPPAG